MKLSTLVIAAALAAGCTVRNDERSFLVGTKIIAATKNPDATATNCLYNPATAETVFGAFDPAFGYVHAVVVENRLPANGAGPGRINTNDFQVEGATVTTDVLLGPAQSIGAQTVPANGLIKAGVLGAPVAIVLAQPGAIAPGSTVRFNVQVFGHLLDGSSVKSNRYEYVADAVAGFISPAPTCTATQVLAACEGGGHQDTTVFCSGT